MKKLLYLMIIGHTIIFAMQHTSDGYHNPSKQHRRAPSSPVKIPQVRMDPEIYAIKKAALEAKRTRLQALLIVTNPDDEINLLAQIHEINQRICQLEKQFSQSPQ